MADEELVALFSKAYAVELEFPLPEDYSIEGPEAAILPCAVYVDDWEMPGIYRIGAIRKALTLAKHTPIAWRHEAGHVTWTWSH